MTQWPAMQRSLQQSALAAHTAPSTAQARPSAQRRDPSAALATHASEQHSPAKAQDCPSAKHPDVGCFDESAPEADASVGEGSRTSSVVELHAARIAPRHASVASTRPVRSEENTESNSSLQANARDCENPAPCVRGEDRSKRDFSEDLGQ
jgi:hypothetical protein